MCAKGWTIGENWVQKGGSSFLARVQAGSSKMSCRPQSSQAVNQTMTSSTCMCLNLPISITDVAAMGCQSSCNWGVQHVQIHGQAASISKM